jgi:hypothetical protein
MTEELALAEHVEDATFVEELNGSATDDAHVLDRALSLTKDRRAAGEELHLRRLGELLQGRLGQVVERGVPTKEFDYVVQGAQAAAGGLPSSEGSSGGTAFSRSTSRSSWIARTA